MPILILKINVTRDDIDNGIRKHGNVCPIALATIHAIKDKFGKEPEGIEADGYIIFTVDGVTYESSFEYCLFLMDWMQSFDEEKNYTGPFEKEIKFIEQEPELEEDYE